MQRRSLKSVYCMTVTDTSSLFNILNILPVTNKIKFNDCVLVHGIVYGNGPITLKNYLLNRNLSIVIMTIDLYCRTLG